MDVTGRSEMKWKRKVRLRKIASSWCGWNDMKKRVDRTGKMPPYVRKADRSNI